MLNLKVTSSLFSKLVVVIFGQKIYLKSMVLMLKKQKLVLSFCIAFINSSINPFPRTLPHAMCTSLIYLHVTFYLFTPFLKNGHAWHLQFHNKLSWGSHYTPHQAFVPYMVLHRIAWLMFLYILIKKVDMFWRFSCNSRTFHHMKIGCNPYH